MMHNHVNVQDRPVRFYTVKAAQVVGALFVLALLTLVSWNMFAPDMLGLPMVRMKQAVGLVLFAGTLTIFIRHAIRR